MGVCICCDRDIIFYGAWGPKTLDDTYIVDYGSHKQREGTIAVRADSMVLRVPMGYGSPDINSTNEHHIHGTFMSHDTAECKSIFGFYECHPGNAGQWTYGNGYRYAKNVASEEEEEEEEDKPRSCFRISKFLDNFQTSDLDSIRGGGVVAMHNIYEWNEDDWELIDGFNMTMPNQWACLGIWGIRIPSGRLFIPHAESQFTIKRADNSTSKNCRVEFNYKEYNNRDTGAETGSGTITRLLTVATKTTTTYPILGAGTRITRWEYAIPITLETFEEASVFHVGTLAYNATARLVLRIDYPPGQENAIYAAIVEEAVSPAYGTNLAPFTIAVRSIYCHDTGRWTLPSGNPAAPSFCNVAGGVAIDDYFRTTWPPGPFYAGHGFGKACDIVGENGAVGEPRYHAGDFMENAWVKFRSGINDDNQIEIQWRVFEIASVDLVDA